MLYKKKIYDSIHGYIELSEMACKVIDTPEFQRLRHIHQLGVCHYVFPSGVHKRFEHSIGTYYLTGKILNCIRRYSNPVLVSGWLSQIPELQEYYTSNYSDSSYPLDDRICELVKIAALTHDLGHGPFSHVFDDTIVKNMPTDQISILAHHEARSAVLLHKILTQDDSFDVTEKEIRFMQNLIKPTESCTGFIYQIVSNYLNGLDVDKYDYLARDTHNVGLKYGVDFSLLVDEIRVIDNTICYPQNMFYEITCLFMTRYRLHKQIYQHKAVINIQYMIADIVQNMDPVLNISGSVSDGLDKFCMFTDDYIFDLTNFFYHNLDLVKSEDREKVVKAYKIMDRLNRRKVYKQLYTYVSETKIDLTVNDIVNACPFLNKEDIIVHQVRIGFISEAWNPLEHIYFYDKRASETCFTINPERVSVVLPQEPKQEHITTIVHRNPDILSVEEIIMFKKIFG